jgi:hypothetical protein
MKINKKATRNKQDRAPAPFRVAQEKQGRPQDRPGVGQKNGEGNAPCLSAIC